VECVRSFGDRRHNLEITTLRSCICVLGFRGYGACPRESIPSR
jgi:hypothetical protein